MSDKENETININNAEDFQTFSKNYKYTNKNEKKPLNIEENYEFTFKKNLFNEQNPKNENNIEKGAKFYNIQKVNNEQMKSKLSNSKLINKNIFKSLFQKNKNANFDDKNCKTVILNNINNKGNKTSINFNNKNNKFIIRKNNIKYNEKIKNNSILNNHISESKTNFIQKYSSKNKSKCNSMNRIIQDNKNKNHSFICQNNKYNINTNNHVITSYKSKIKKNISAKIININCENNKTSGNTNKSLKSIKFATQKNISHKNISKQNKKTENKFTKKNKLEKVKSKIKSSILKLHNNQNYNNRIKIDKSPLSCKNQIRNIYMKENKYKDFHVSCNVCSNINRINNNKLNTSSIIIKKNRTFLNINNNIDKKPSKSNTKVIIKKKLTPDKKNIFSLFKK